MSGDPFLHYRIFRFLIAQNLQGGRLRRKEASLQLYGVWKGNVYKNVRMEKNGSLCDKMIEENNFGSLKWENAEGI